MSTWKTCISVTIYCSSLSSVNSIYLFCHSRQITLRFKGHFTFRPGKVHRTSRPLLPCLNTVRSRIHDAVVISQRSILSDGNSVSCSRGLRSSGADKRGADAEGLAEGRGARTGLHPHPWRWAALQSRLECFGKNAHTWNRFWVTSFLKRIYCVCGGLEFFLLDFDFTNSRCCLRTFSCLFQEPNCDQFTTS